ncbi:unnamed protein product [Prunus armeniaca]|uniref:Uncharacterized protein n=1 Tax=Prunus armeniaca TaxID=36596 RepID=A0A6J5V999_PRUAR|nr:unnamed protein product [Prunus armeniaca]
METRGRVVRTKTTRTEVVLNPQHDFVPIPPCRKTIVPPQLVQMPLSGGATWLGDSSNRCHGGCRLPLPCWPAPPSKKRYGAAQTRHVGAVDVVTFTGARVVCVLRIAGALREDFACDLYRWREPNSSGLGLV